MSDTVTLLTDRSGFEAVWRPALEPTGLATRTSAPDSLANAIDKNAALVVDASCEAYDEDELLTALGFARALGAVTIVHLPEDGRMSSVDDIVDEICTGLVARSSRDVSRLATAIARRLDRGRARRFEFVTVSPRHGEVLALLGDGSSILLKRPLDDTDDGSEIESIALADDASSASLELGGGKTIELRATGVASQARSHGPNGGNGIPIEGARLGARLRELRLGAGLTQAELARRTGIHRPNIARVEAGRHTPSLDTLARLAQAIGVSTTQVLSED